MRLIVRKALNFVDHDDQQSFKKDLGPILESLNANFFQFFAKIIKSFVLSS